MAHFRRPHPDPKRDSYKVKDTCYKAGRAAVMERKRRLPVPYCHEHEECDMEPCLYAAE